MKKIRDKQQIQNIIYYLIKWADWSFKYNFYKLTSHLADAFKAVINYEQKLKHKCKKTSQANIDEVLDSEDAPCKWVPRWDHMLYLIHSVLNEALKSHGFEVCFRISTNFWVNCIAFHPVSYSFYFQLQPVHQAVESCCVKSERYFNESWH